MRFALVVLLALIASLSASPAFAQNGGQIFDFFAGQINQQMQRQQQRQFERQQQQQSNQNYQIFLAAWNDCFDNNNLTRCDFALRYPMGPDDRQRLLIKRAQIVAALQAQQEQVRRDQAERVRVARQAEEQRIAGLRALGTALDGCRQFVVGSCDAARNSAFVTSDDVAKIVGWREVATRLADSRVECNAGSIAACDAALASPAVTDADRRQLTEWRTAASPIKRALANITDYGTTALAAAQTLPATIGELPLSTQISGGIAIVLAFTLAAVMLRRSPAPATLAGQSVPPALPAPSQRRQFAPGIWSRLNGAAYRILSWFRVARTTPAEPAQASKWRVQPGPTPAAAVQPPPIPAAAAKMQPAPLPDTVDQPSVSVDARPAAVEKAVEPVREQLPAPVTVPERVRDTPAAIIALQLANAYIDEVRKTPTPQPDDKAGLREALSTLALATKQLAVAEQKDPDAIAEIECDGEKLPFNLADLQSEALLQEGAMLWRTSPGRAKKALELAMAITPDLARPYYFLGLIHSGEHNPQRAAAALQKAVDLEPTNIEYHKALDRARNISGGEVVGYKVTRAGERVYDTAIGVANTGIKAWNIFAITYNIITAPIRIPLKIALWIAGHK